MSALTLGTFVLSHGARAPASVMVNDKRLPVPLALSVRAITYIDGGLGVLQHAIVQNKKALQKRRERERERVQ